ncbi:PSP1 C-terminal conserved region-domain-containing protein [Cunninghamella echinulata]|nr:PSP1 C-terminal conserved region-domain-containing protein [Cunninghamella echinulata]
MSQNSLPRRNKQSEQSTPISIPNVNNPATLDEAWKVVGSPSRRGSLAALVNNNTATEKQSPAASPTPNSMDIPNNRRPSMDTSQWGSFGGFQWEGPGIFDNEMRKSSISNPTHVLPPPPEVLVEDAPYNTQRRSSFAYDNSGNNNSILSVPMLPGVSVEPIYRQQRSLSFSVGQDPTLFGYNDYDEDPSITATTTAATAATAGMNGSSNINSATSYGYKTSLATMEEEEDDDILQDTIDQQLSAARWRSRSQSSGAAFGLLSATQHAALLGRHLRRGSEQHDDLTQQRRRSSRFFVDNAISPDVNNANTASPSTQPIYSQMSMGDKERLELFQRRLSQSHTNEYKFPDQSYNLLHQRRSSLNQSQHPHSMQQITEQMEATHIRPADPNYSLHRVATDSYGQMMHSHGYPSQLLPQQLLMNRPPHEEYFDAEHHQQQQQPNLMTSGAFRDAGKGIPLQRLPNYTNLYSVEFKAGRIDYFYVVSEPGTVAVKFQPGDLVIVEGDRGKDLGKVASDTLTIEQVEQYVSQKLHHQQQQQQQGNGNGLDEDETNGNNDKPKDVHIKRLYRLATPDEINLLLAKGQDELRALALCQQRTKMRNLPMDVVDAEYQWDRRKLTFFFISDRRIDFRELVRELFKIYKTRIWMCAVNTNTTIIPSDIENYTEKKIDIHNNITI